MSIGFRTIQRLTDLVPSSSSCYNDHMRRNVRTKDQQRHTQAAILRSANAPKKRSTNKDLDIRGPVLHDGTSQKQDLNYTEYLKTRHWSIVRRLAIQRANSCCSVCDSPYSLQVHHLTYENLWHEYANDITVLCDTCHAMLHGVY